MAELSLQPSPRGPSPSQAFREVALLGLRQSIPKVLLATSAQLWPGSRRQRLIPEALGQVRAPPAASTWAGAPGQLRGTELSLSRGFQEAAAAKSLCQQHGFMQLGQTLLGTHQQLLSWQVGPSRLGYRWRQGHPFP